LFWSLQRLQSGAATLDQRGIGLPALAMYDK
jgi:hypothetical protein